MSDPTIREILHGLLQQERTQHASIPAMDATDVIAAHNVMAQLDRLLKSRWEELGGPTPESLDLPPGVER